MKNKINNNIIESWEKLLSSVKGHFELFLKSQLTGGIILLFCTILTLFVANSPFSEYFYNFFHVHIKIKVYEFILDKPLHMWINELLMSFFFLLMGLEIKREIICGELSSFKKASLPLFAAVGGVIIPAVIYYIFNNNGIEQKGWAIPMATDIAFVVGIMSLLKSKIPSTLFTIVVAIAIVDDIIAVVVIALFYTSDINFMYLGIGGGITLILILMNRFKIHNYVYYLLVGAILWFCFYKSGVHSTLSGIIVAFSIPAFSHYSPSKYYKKMVDLLDEYRKSFKTNPNLLKNTKLSSVLTAMELGVHKVQSPLLDLEHKLSNPVSFIIIPLFALANAGVSFNFDSISDIINNNVTMGISIALIFGKSIGIFSSIMIIIKLKIADIDKSINIRHILGIAFLSGIGFTMSIFISDLAFDSFNNLFTAAKTGIILGSFISALIGVIILSISKKR